MLAPPGRHRAPLPTGGVESSAHFFMTIIAVAMRATAIAPPTKILFCSSFCFFAGHAPGSHAQLPVPHPQDPSVHVQSGPQVHTMVVCLRRTREGSRAGWVARAAVMGAHQTGVSVAGGAGSRACLPEWAGCMWRRTIRSFLQKKKSTTQSGLVVWRTTLLSLKSLCGGGGGVPSSHPSLRRCLFSFFLSLIRTIAHRADFVYRGGARCRA